MTIELAVRSNIEARLRRIEDERSVQIFYACESGSRAWDFASEDSDYDVRFLYVHPRDWYLSLVEQRDVIETPIEGVYDVNGWDMRKALRLAAKGNPVLFEWLASPIRYLERPLAERFRVAAIDFYDPAAAFHHYLSMARGQVRAYLTATTALHKKYFYALRPLLACRYVLAHADIIPIRFGDLLDAVDVPHNVRSAVADLLAAKRRTGEAQRGERVGVLDSWIEETIAQLQQATVSPVRPKDFTRLDAFFAAALTN
jgi:predicted nucleotidyltransferase